MTTVGIECEVGHGIANVLDELADAGLVPEPRLHSYHCGCGTCHYTNTDYPFAAQADCTVAGEIISKVFEYGTDAFDTAVAGLARCLVAGRARAHGQTGFHVHVGFPDDQAARTRLYAMAVYWQDDLHELGGGPDAVIRAYNYPLNRQWLEGDRNPVKGFWLAYRPDIGTIEFRLWDGTTSEFRMRLAVGLSVAMVRAALDGVTATEQSALVPTLAPYLDAETLGGVLAQSLHVETL